MRLDGMQANDLVRFKIFEPTLNQLCTNFALTLYQLKKDVEKNILSNPFKRFEDMRFLMCCKDVETVEVNPIIFRKLTREDWLHIVDVCDKSLEKYYARFQK